MTTKTVLVLAVVAALVGVGFYTYGGNSNGTGNSTSVAGNTFNAAKTAMIVWSPISASATTTSILNTDANDRIIKQAQYSCTGLTNSFAQTAAGVAALIFQAATTSASAPANFSGNTNFVLNTTVATSTAELFVGSTTPGATASSFVRRWGAGTYLTFSANATSSAQTCVIGVDYLGT